MEDEAVALQDECSSLQDDELVALKAIYPADQLRIVPKDGKRLHEITFNLPISLPQEIDVYVQRSEASGEPILPLKLLHLPPLALTVSLPSLYPLQTSPHIIRVFAPWIASSRYEQIEWINNRLRELWLEAQGEVLWTYAEWLREGWVEEALRPRSSSPFSDPKHERALIVQADVITSQKGDLPTSSHLTATLTAYDRLARQSVFGKERFLCSICLEAKKGESCTRITACGHVFCKDCLHDYLTLHLTEGSLRLALSCPDASCVSMVSRSQRGEDDRMSSLTSNTTKVGTVGVDELMEFLKDSPELLRRLMFLQKKDVAEADPTAVPCPRMDCQTLTPKDISNDSSSRWEAFRQCPCCSYTFCVWCRKTWHAPTPCSLPSTSSLLDKYDAASAEIRRAMEARYGRKNLLRLKAIHLEEKANQEWLKGKTQACPHCSSRVEKSSGCNHMTCQHCQTHFCYLCGTRIDASHPYVHFNTNSSSCFNRLFDGIFVQMPEDGEEGEDNEEDQGRAETHERRREEEQHFLALAAIQAAYGEE